MGERSSTPTQADPTFWPSVWMGIKQTAHAPPLSMKSLTKVEKIPLGPATGLHAQKRKISWLWYLEWRDSISIYSHPVRVQLDYIPLHIIMAKPLVSSPKRLQLMLMYLQHYQVEFRYCPGLLLVLAVSLSRTYMTNINKLGKGD